MEAIAFEALMGVSCRVVEANVAVLRTIFLLMAYPDVIKIGSLKLHR